MSSYWASTCPLRRLDDALWWVERVDEDKATPSQLPSVRVGTLPQYFGPLPVGLFSATIIPSEFESDMPEPR